ncbi:MAG: hypothetical protein AAGF12_38280 [Myxococcota bacterium]
MFNWRLLIGLLGLSAGACGLSHDSNPELSEETPLGTPPGNGDGECPHWFLVERVGTGTADYHRFTYDAQMRVVLEERGNASRSRSGEYHESRRVSYGSGTVTSELDAGDAPNLDGVVDFAEIIELDEARRPVRILGRDAHAFAEPNRVETREYDSEGRLAVTLQQDQYANRNRVDRRCSYEYNPQGQLSVKDCTDGTTRFGWSDAGELLFRELTTDRFTSRQDYTYEEGRLTGAVSGDFSERTFTYDNGRLVRAFYRRFDGLGGGISDYEYDREGRLSLHIQTDLEGTIRDTTSFIYDDEGRLVDEVSDIGGRSYDYELRNDELTVTERSGETRYNTRRYVCSQTTATGLPVFVDPDPSPNGDRVLPDDTVLPRPFPE